MDVTPLGSPLTIPLESMTAASVGDIFDGLASGQTTTSATHLHLPVLGILRPPSEPGPPRLRVYSTDAQNFSHDMMAPPCRSRAKSVEAVVPNFSTNIPCCTSGVGISKPIAKSPGAEKGLRVGMDVNEPGYLRSQSNSSNPQQMTITTGSKERNKIEREFCGDIIKHTPSRRETQSTLGVTIETPTSNEGDPIIHLRRATSFDDLSAVSSLSDTHSYQNLDSKSGRRLGSLFNRKKRQGKGMSFGTAIKGSRRDDALNESLSRETMDRSLEQHLLCRSARSLNQPDVDNNKHRRRIKSGEDEKNTGIKSSWLIPISSAPQKGDMIDMKPTDPVDPFSGLIGMPQGDVSAASEKLSSCLDVFGSPVSKSSLGGVSPLESPCIDQACRSSLQSNRPSVISHSRRSRTCGASVTSDFDPLYEDEEYTSSSIVGGQSFGSSTAHSALHSGLPPRRHKDDPLLSKSRYRSPLLFASPDNSGRVSSRKSKNGHRGGHNRVASIDNCMFGSIAQVELSSSHKCTQYPTTPGSIGDMIDCQSEHRSVDETATVSITPVECMASLNTSPVEEEGEEVGSVESFEEELRKGDGKAKVITKEVKNVFQPLAVSARKLLRIPKQEASTLRADGCLT